jgi:hypothetical protein
MAVAAASDFSGTCKPNAGANRISASFSQKQFFKTRPANLKENVP